MLLTSVVDTLLMCFGATILLAFLAGAIVSFRERHRRAGTILLFGGILFALPFGVLALISFAGRTPVALTVLVVVTVVILVTVIPTRRSAAADDDTPTGRIDERDTMFARNRLVPGSDHYSAYYADNPEKEFADQRFRKRPGLLAEGSEHYNAVMFAAADASFRTVGELRSIAAGDPAPRQIATEIDQITEFVTQWARKLGAVSVGITRLRDYHLYSHRGRTEPYGEPIDLDHRYAIALSVEMDRSAMDHAPLAPTLMESAQQYVHAGAIAVQIAEFIRNLGHAAEAHIDGNYRVVCPLVARDAGLGEIGRMGLLMTPEYGPRVRLSVVTTNLPLRTDGRNRDTSVADFCGICRKCATNCPAGAISGNPPTEIDGVRRWQINQELCFTYWCKIGTDCGRCVSVCPYSHADTVMHRIVRVLIRRSWLFRRVAVRLDDILYGRIMRTTQG